MLILQVQDVQFVSNRAERTGGAISALAHGITTINTTFAGNMANYGGGIAVRLGLAGQWAAGCAVDLSPALTLLLYCHTLRRRHLLASDV